MVVEEYLHSYCTHNGLIGLQHWYVSMGRLCIVTNKEPELWPALSVATCIHRQLLHSISLKGDPGANQSAECLPLLGAQAVPGICRLLESWALASAPSFPLPLLQYCISAVWHAPPPPLSPPSSHIQADCHRQVLLRRSRLIKHNLRLPSHPTIAHISMVPLEISHINTSLGTWREAPQSTSGRKMMLNMRKEPEPI